LFFKREFQEAIRAGRKRSTIRRWNKPPLRAGAEAFSPGLGWLAIEAVEAVELDRLGDEDARADGFDTAKAMRQVLLKLYPSHATDGRQWYRVLFRLHKLAEGNGGARKHADGNPCLFDR